MKPTCLVISTALTLIALAITSPAQAGDVGGYSLNKQANYDQTSAGTPYLDPTQPYQFTASVQGNGTASFYTSTTLSTPGSGTLAYTANSNGLFFLENFISKNAMDTAFGAGTYNLSLWTSTPNHYNTQLVISTDAYPTVIPQITTVTNAGWVNGQSRLVIPDSTLTNSLAVTLNWPSFTGGSIYLNVNGSGSNIVSSQVTGTSYTFPGGTFKSGQYYQVQLTFYTNFVTNSNPNPIPNSGGGVGYSAQVSLILQAGSSTTPSKLQYSVQKREVLTQTSTNTPTGLSGWFGYGDPGPYDCTIQSTTSGTVTGPSSTSFPLTFTSYNESGKGGDYETSSGPLATQNLLDTAYPTGSYTFPDSTTLSFATPYTVAYPNIPQVTQVNSATPVWSPQGQLLLDPTVSNTITWTALNTQSDPNYFEQFDLESDNGGNVSLSQKAGITTTNTTLFNTYTIPANTLTAGSTYTTYVSYGLGNASTSGNTIHFAGYNTENYFSVLAEPSSYNSLLQVNTPSGSTWVASPWFGTVNVSNSSFIYSLYLGFAAPFDQDYRGVWFYDSTISDFIWTSNNTFPYFYGNKNSKWYFLYTSSSPSSPAYASIYEFNGRGWIFLSAY